MCHRGHLLVNKKNDHQDLRQEGIYYCFVKMQSGLCSKMPLSLKLNPQPWREEIDTICQSFDCTIRNPEKWEHFFRISYIDALSLKSGSTSPVRSCLLKFFWYWTMPLAIQNPINSILQGIKVVYLSPNTTSLIQPLDQRVIRTFNAHYI